LFLRNPERVLRDTLKPLVQLPSPRADKVEVVPCAQDKVSQMPVTLLTAEALIPLHNLIKQDAYTLNETSKQRLQRHVEKLASAA
jgi:hypothetical protein